MIGRFLALSAALLALALLVGCGSTQELSSITVTPTTATATVGNTAQFEATGTFTNGKRTTSQNLTTQVIWSSSVVSVATINSAGLATATGPGITTITATGGNGGITGTATLNVTSSSGGAGTLTSLTVFPATQVLTVSGATAQFIAIGTFAGSPSTQDLTDQVTWSSSNMPVATINSSGVATAVANCIPNQSTTISALPPGGVISAATATLNLGSCGSNPPPTLIVYEVGQGSGTVTSVPVGINCNASGGGAGCTANNFGLGTSVTLTAAPASGFVFGGWSANCIPATAPTCTVTMIDNVTVGAIFDSAP